MSDELRDRVAIVTGSGTGLGREHVLAMARAGAKVVVNDIGVNLDGTGSSTAPAESVADEVRALGGEAVANFDSVADFDSAGRIVQAAVDAFGRVDILVNNANVFHGAMFLELDERQWDAQLGVHVKGAYNMCQHVVPVMAEAGWGRIINTTSQSAFGGLGYTAYATAKAALIGFTYSLAAECWPKGITVNALAPDAGTHHRLASQQDWLDKALAAGFAVPDLASIKAPPPPEFVPPIVLFLTSDAGASVSGRVFYAGGGTVAMYPHPTQAATVTKRIEDGPWTVEELSAIAPSLLVGGGLAPGIGP